MNFKIAVTGIIVLGIVGTASYQIYNNKRAALPAPSVASKGLAAFPKVVDKTTEALQKQEWEKVQTLLDDPKTHSAAVSQVLRFSEKSENRVHQGPIFDLLAKDLKKAETSISDRVLIFRAISYMNLTADQQKEIRKIFKEQKFAKESLPQVFISTVPFPTDVANLIADQATAKIRTNTTEALYMAGLIKDTAAKQTILRKYLAKYSVVHASLKPHVAKFIFVHADESLRKEKSYQKLVESVRKQKGDFWAEVIQVIP